MEDKANKTEKATPRRRAKAREDEGKVANSKEIIGVALLVVVCGTMALIMDWAGGNLVNYCRTVLGGLHHATQQQTSGWYTDLVPVFAGFLIPVGITGGISVLASGFAQTGGLFTLKPLRPKPEKLNPLPQLKQMFASKQAVIQMLQAAGKVVVITGLTFQIFMAEIKAMIGFSALTPIEILRSLAGAIFRLGWRIVLLFIVFAVIDYVVKKRKLDKDLRMSKREVKEENKQNEGDPEVKKRQFMRRVEMSRGRMLSEVPEADVVLVNPTHYAVALKYEAGMMSAPTLTAKGKDHLAARIRKLARAHKVPVIHNPPLTRALFAETEPGEEVPDRLYGLVAEVLAYVYKLRGRIQ